jgi:hypothetical protein
MDSSDWEQWASVYQAGADAAIRMPENERDPKPTEAPLTTWRSLTAMAGRCTEIAAAMMDAERAERRSRMGGGGLSG